MPSIFTCDRVIILPLPTLSLCSSLVLAMRRKRRVLVGSWEVHGRVIVLLAGALVAESSGIG